MPAKVKKRASKERRKNFRLPLADFYLVVVRDRPNRHIPAAIVDASMGGARIFTHVPLTVDNQVEMVFEMNDGTLSVPARIVWEKKSALKFMYGVEFLNHHLDALARQILIEYHEKTRSISALKNILAALQIAPRPKKNGRRRSS